jgi:hypothetical protein
MTVTLPWGASSGCATGAGGEGADELSAVAILGLHKTAVRIPRRVGCDCCLSSSNDGRERKLRTCRNAGASAKYRIGYPRDWWPSTIDVAKAPQNDRWQP